MKTKHLKAVLASIVTLSLIILPGCSKKDSNNAASATTDKKVTLNMAVNFSATEAVIPLLKEIAVNYTKENPNVEVQVASLPDYEATMKTKMAAKDLPDIFTTHGWSVMRYSAYLTPLQDQPWASKVNPQIKPIITNSKGEIFVLPADADVAGITFNKDVLDEAGVNPDTIKTWDDFKAACEKIKAKGKTPIQLGGAKDDWTVGSFFDWISSSFLVTNNSKNYRSQLLDGTFDWNNYKPVYNLFDNFNKAGYFNKDAKEGTYQSVTEAFAKGNAGFAFFGNFMLADAWKINPNGNYGFMSIPAATSDDTPTVISGEGKAFGVWKDSKNKDEALKFLNHLAKPENTNKIAATSMAPTGLIGDGYKTDAGKLTQYFEKNKNVRSFGYFDRAYLPNGMWDSLVNTGSAAVFGSMNADQVSAKMKADYDKLKNQK